MVIISNRHQWTVAFGVLGNVISVLVYLSPVPTFYRIYKKKSTESFQSLPYQVALFSCMLWLYYALLKTDAFLLITINSFGCVIETIYVTMYVAYAPRDKKISAAKLFVAMNVVAFSSILLLTRFLVDDKKSRYQVVGWICVGVSACVFAAPLNVLARVIRTRSVEFMPFTLSFFLTLSAIMWFAYGMFLKDIRVALPNVAGFFLGMLQMVLYAIYRKSRNVLTVDDEEEMEEVKTVVVFSPLGVSEVHQADVQSNTNVEDDGRGAEGTDDHQGKGKEASSQNPANRN